jgi:hypothetical protein
MTVTAVALGTETVSHVETTHGTLIAERMLSAAE